MTAYRPTDAANFEETTESITVDGQTARFGECGAGETVILLHCSAGSGAQWTALKEELADRFHVIALDLVGYGGSDRWHCEDSFTLDDEVKFVDALIERVGRPVHLVGHSYGGAVALHAALTRPDMIQSLTLIEPAAFQLLLGGDLLIEEGTSDWDVLEEICGVAQKVADALMTGDMHAGMGAFVDYWNGPGAWDATKPHRKDDLSRSLVKIGLDFRAGFSEERGLRDCRKLDLPTLILRGDQSPRPATRVCELLEMTVDGARMQTIMGAGHMLPLTHSSAVNRGIAAHLDGVSEQRWAA